MASSPTPPPVRRAMVRIGSDLSSWRKLRALTAAEVGDRAGIGTNTVLRLEAGDGATLENVLRVARALGVLEQVTAAFDPYSTDVGRMRADEQLPTRVRRPREP
ncbi:MAG TPA: helix-turn-helix transcriptional regulator [Cellulomonas sp.]|nr:helix-turn-helix transcriptional regulator [Cellulomonas sp.]